MPTKKDSRDVRSGPIMPGAVTSTAAWAVQCLDARLRTAIDGVLADRATDLALTVRGYWLLEAIGPAPAHSQSELCDLLGIDRSDMVRLVDVLEGADLVERVRDTADRRRQLIGPTTVGATLRDSIRDGIADAEARVFADVPAAAREALTAALSARPSDEGESPNGRDTAAAAPEPPKKQKKKRKKKKKKGGKRR
ncbi:MarR family winged helix-turn-helix transcriptional regulator [Corynebacterium sp. HMSC11E11]|uniref:MarR family winged helix-turn-helix transcriptional regulator n=1 Tax=Corynebacterium sp. HMSC11E11 TaxID=1581089 RepID=UPI001FEF27B4|nr:MarR family winged helix-turn-helix transcriptional regulator [Corynebacterium sp. HMSC11E11]